MDNKKNILIFNVREYFGIFLGIKVLGDKTCCFSKSIFQFLKIAIRINGMIAFM